MRMTKLQQESSTTIFCTSVLLYIVFLTPQLWIIWNFRIFVQVKYLKYIWLNGTKLNSLTFDFEYLGSKLSDIANVLINKEMVMWYLLYTITVHKELMDTHTLTLSDLSWEKGFCAGSWSIPPPILKPRIRLSPCRNFWISIRSCSTEEEKTQNQPHLHRALHRQLKNRDTQN